MAWLSNWAKRIELTIDSGDIDAALVDFPVLIHLSTASGRTAVDVSCVFDELTLDANRKKIAVTTSDGQTQCYVEVEKWDDANEQAWLWVKVPSIASGADTDLYLYYDNSHADNIDYVGDTNSTPAENVWDANFVLVDHMQDDPDTSHTRDSTTNDIDGTKVTSNQPIEVAGKIGDAQSFDGAVGNDDKITYPDQALLDIEAEITLEVFINLNSLDRWNTLCWKSNAYGLKVTDANTARITIYKAGGGVLSAYSGAISASGVDHYIVGTYNKVQGICYLDAVAGTPVAETDDIQASAIDLFLGYYFVTSHDVIDGLIDEFRVSSTARSAAWIKASYESGKDDLIAFGAEAIFPALWDFFTWG